MSIFTKDKRGSSTELPAGDPRRGGATVEYGKGHGRAEFCYQSDFAGAITNHGEFDPFYRENYDADRREYFQDQASGHSDFKVAGVQMDKAQADYRESMKPVEVANWPARVNVEARR